MKITVIGLGFVGLTTALGFATKGFEVYGYDKEIQRVSDVKSGKVPFFEKDLTEVLEKVNQKKFFVVDDLESAVKDRNIIFYCVGTPCDDKGEADLTYLIDAVRECEKHASDKCIHVIKSTVPPTTTKNVIKPMIGEKAIVMNPEFLREGCAWEDFIHPDRIVIGTEDERARKIMEEVYASFKAPICNVNSNTAEFIKYLSNNFLANIISFSNEMAGLADMLGGIEVARAFKVLCEDKRLKNAGICSYIYPGCGYGGSCLPKDTNALKTIGNKMNYEMPLLEAVMNINDLMPKKIANKIMNLFDKEELPNRENIKCIGILGLAFKPESDDVRYSSAAKIIEELNKIEHVEIYAYDPIANKNFDDAYRFDNINYSESMEEVCGNCSVVAVVTTWPEFKKVDKMYPEVQFVDCRYFLEGE